MRGAGLALILATLSACADPTPTTGSSTGDACRVARVLDGDTVVLSCPGEAPERARLTGYDTPEVFSPGCRAERALGETATERLRALVRDGETFTITRRGYDRYDRRLAKVAIDGRDVGDILVSEGLALRYSGGRRIDWCRKLS